MKTSKTKTAKILLSCFFFFAIVGCGATLQPDPSPKSAIDAGLYTVEWEGCKQIFNGIGFCAVEKGKSFPSLKVQGYFKGTVTINSEACGIDESFRYEKNAGINVPLPSKATESCVIDVVLSPELPKEEDSGLRVFPIKGRVYLRVIDKDWKFFGQENTLPEGVNRRLTVPFEFEGKPRVVFRGCGTQFDKKVETENKKVSVSLSDITEVKEKTCIFNGAVISASKVVRLTWMVNIYDNEISQQPEPSTKIEDERLTVEADPAATIISLDKKSTIGNEAEFSFDPSKPHILRSLTVKGRNIFGLWDPENKSWRWIR